MRKEVVNREIELVVDSLILKERDLEIKNLTNLRDTCLSLRDEYLDFMDRTSASAIIEESMKNLDVVKLIDGEFIVEVRYSTNPLDVDNYEEILELSEFYILNDDLSLFLLKGYDGEGLCKYNDDFNQLIDKLEGGSYKANMLIKFDISQDDIISISSFKNSKFSQKKHFKEMLIKKSKFYYQSFKYSEGKYGRVKLDLLADIKTFKDVSENCYLGVVNLPVYRSIELDVVAQEIMGLYISKEIRDFKGSILELRSLLSGGRAIETGLIEVNVKNKTAATVDYDNIILRSNKYGVRGISSNVMYNNNLFPNKFLKAFSLKGEDSISITPPSTILKVDDIINSISKDEKDYKDIALKTGAHRYSPVVKSGKELYNMAAKKFIKSYEKSRSTTLYKDNFTKVSSVNLKETEGDFHYIGMSRYLYKDTYDIRCNMCDTISQKEFYANSADDMYNDDEAFRCKKCGSLLIPGYSVYTPREVFKGRYTYLDHDGDDKLIVRNITISQGLNGISYINFERLIFFGKEYKTQSEYYRVGLEYKTENVYDLLKLPDNFSHRNKENHQLGDLKNSILKFSDNHSHESSINYYDINLLPFNKAELYELSGVGYHEPLQTRDEYIKILSEVESFKYSAIDHIIYKDSITGPGMLDGGMYYLILYLLAYQVYPSLEFMVKIDKMESLLGHILDMVNPYDGVKGILNRVVNQHFDFKATDLKGLLRLSNRQFNLLMETACTMNDLVHVKTFKTNEDYWLYMDNDFYVSPTERKRFDLEDIDEVYYIAETYGKKFSDIFNYIIRLDRDQAIPSSEACNLYSDYLNMMRLLDYDLTNNDVFYPNALGREHDLAVRRYNDKKSEAKQSILLDEERRSIKNHKKYEFKSSKYSVIAPKRLKDVEDEGRNLNHCVGSYVDKVDSGRSIIMFLRETDNLDKALYTIEIQNNRIVQLRGMFNKDLDKEKDLVKFVEVYKEFIYQMLSLEEDKEIIKLRDKLLKRLDNQCEKEIA